MTMDGWKLFGAYIRQHVWVLAAAAGAAGLFLAVIALYQLPAEAVGYASALAGLFLLAAGVLRFRQFSRRHRTLAALQSQMSVPGVSLPETDDLIERDYQALIRLLDQERGAIVFAKDRAYQEMVDYYTIWAHQIKTPIAAMRLLLQADGEPDRDELAEQLFRIEQYTEMVLQFIRLGGKGTDFVFRAVSLDDCVRQAVRKYAKWFIRKQIRLHYEPLGVSVLTDEKWLVFVLEQLLSNALKYTHQGAISIFMHPSRPMALVIEDTGIGIDPADLPRVFEHGYTGFTGRADKKSTGIGLYLCKRILDRLNHTITIGSEVGRGTKVILGLESRPLDVRQDGIWPIGAASNSNGTQRSYKKRRPCHEHHSDHRRFLRIKRRRLRHVPGSRRTARPHAGGTGDRPRVRRRPRRTHGRRGRRRPGAGRPGHRRPSALSAGAKSPMKDCPNSSSSTPCTSGKQHDPACRTRPARIGASGPSAAC